jgi:hypothetical protein
MRQKDYKLYDAGYSIFELLVTVSLISLVGIMVTKATLELTRLVSKEEYRARNISELSRAIHTLSKELHSAYSLSPYIVPLNASLLDCRKLINVSPFSITFIASYDNHVTNGRVNLWVGYQYNPLNKVLYRGEVTLPSNSCRLPSTSPLHTSLLFPIASSVEQIKSQVGNLEPVFKKVEDKAVLVSLQSKQGNSLELLPVLDQFQAVLTIGR